MKHLRPTRIYTVYRTSGREIEEPYQILIASFIYILGWVNLYKKFEIEKYTVCGKLILPKKMEGIFFWHNWLANLHGFANICKLPVSNTFKDMQSKI